MTKNYQFDPNQRIWATSSDNTLSYSDGDKNEEYLFSAITNAKDVSSNSPELFSAIRDWPSEYHLSPVRHNLLRPFLFEPSDHILELGCGCGAMTRYLGETGAKVVAVEGSRRRAMIAAERCRDLPNVSVYCDNLIDFQTDGVFDFVTLIGVLEYSNQFIAGPEPVHACLKKAGSFLNTDGALILAIENQLGLKYFNGCNEDHLGIPYFGINGLYRKGDPVTFGRHALAENLNESGFPVHDFFYPFPDYKLPGLILSEAALCEGQLNVADLLIHNTGHDYPDTKHRAFAEDLAWKVAAENRLIAKLANSFLVIARPQTTDTCRIHWLAKIFSRGRRFPCYQVETTIAFIKESNLGVFKNKLCQNPKNDGQWLQHTVKDGAYISGNVLLGKIHRAMASEAELDELASCFKPWLDFMRNHATNNNQDKLVLPGNFIDCVPANMIESSEGFLHYFDAEWTSKVPIPMVWTVIRGIAYSLIGCLENASLKHMTYRQFVSTVAEFSQVHLSEADFVIADNWEARLVTQCHMDAATTPRLSTFYDEPLFLMRRLTGNIPELRHRLAWYEAELARVKGTFSWKLTIPLRVGWNIFKKFFSRRTHQDGNAS